MMSPHWMLAQLETLNWRECLLKTKRSTGLLLTEFAASCSFWSARRFIRPVPRKLMVAVAMICEYSVSVLEFDMYSSTRLQQSTTWSV